MKIESIVGSIVRALRWCGPCVALLLGAGAIASDGALEINQACVASGCFPGDAPGFPVEITASAPGRSFRLTGDLNQPNVALATIAITTGPLTLDLGGFSIRGPASCSLGGFGVTCANTGSGTAIDGSTAVGVTIRGGDVIGAPGKSIALGALATVTDVKVIFAGGDGITAGNGSRIERCTVADVNGVGVRASESSVFDALIHEPRLSAVEGTNATYTTAIRNVHATRWGLPLPGVPFVNTVSVGTNLCNGSSC